MRDIIPTMSSDTAPSGVCFASGNASGGTPAWKAFNDSLSSPDTNFDRVIFVGETAELGYQFPSAEAVGLYSLTPHIYPDSTGPAQMPASWTFEGSNDGSSWDVLDTQSGHVAGDWTAGVANVFTLAVSAPYTYYRVNCNGSNSSGYIVIGEMEMGIQYGGEAPYADDDYTVVRFLESGEFVTPEGVNEGDVLVVAGGGSGGKGTPGTCYGGGGGGGGVIEDVVTFSGTMAVVIGAGGTGGASITTTDDGDDSSFGGLTAYGGKGGFVNSPEKGEGGPSGAPESYEGGQSAALPNAYEGGGGGGAGGSPSDPKNGGPGYESDITGTAVRYGGGGGGGGDSWFGIGTDGGGNGAIANGAPPASGSSNTGSGGGAIRGDDAAAAGSGGSGVVIIRFLSPPIAYTETIDGEYTLRVYDTVGVGTLSLPDGWQSWMRARALVVAGGGGGSAPGDYMHGTGGGGAGGYLYEAEFELTENMTIAVGAGGAISQHGDDSILGALHAIGGGGAQNGSAGDGGSSGGMNAYSQGEGGQQIGTPVSGQGHYGGLAANISAGETAGGGGGGGAGSAADAGTTHYQADSTGGAGGLGLANDITGSSLTYAAGGKGGDMAYSGGGSPSNGAAGTSGRGNGGGGGNNAGSSAGVGGSGVVIIRFWTPRNAGKVTLGSPRATGAGHVSGAYPGVGSVTLGAARVAGQGRTPIWGAADLTIGAVEISLGISANTVYVHSNAFVRVASNRPLLISGLGDAVTIRASENYGSFLSNNGRVLSLDCDCIVMVGL